MERVTLLSKHPEFQSFEITHWMEDELPMFGVAWGWSFSDFYSSFSANEFRESLDRPEIEKQIHRVHAEWFLDLMSELASGTNLTTAQIQERAALAGNR